MLVMNMTVFLAATLGVLFGALVALAGDSRGEARPGALTTASGQSVATNAAWQRDYFVWKESAGSLRPITNTMTGLVYQPVVFETLASFPIKVDWLMNPTNSAFDTLRREGNIPAVVQALDGKNVTVQGFLKPLQQDVGGVTEFLLMRNHALCCQTNIPQINEWIHVRMTGRSVSFAHEREYSVQGVLQVGELRSPGNVVSIYRLSGEEIVTAPVAH